MKKIIKIFYIILIILFATNSSAQSMFWPARLVLSLSNTISMQTTADFNSDGILDLVAIDTDPHSGKIYIVFGDLATNYEIIEITNDTLFQNGHQGSNMLKIADYNGDGKQDIVLGLKSQSNIIYIFPGDGTGNFSEPVAFKPHNLGLDLQNFWPDDVTDFNNDGFCDIIYRNNSYLTKNSVYAYILLGDGEGSFYNSDSLINQFQLQAFGSESAISDFNEDGALDVAFLPFLSGTEGYDSIAVYLGDSSGKFSMGEKFAVFIWGGKKVDVNDFNGDQHSDILVTKDIGAGEKSFNIILGNGNGSFITSKKIEVDRAIDFVTPADVNGDGVLDLVLVSPDYNYTNKDYYGIMFGTGNANFEQPQWYSVTNSNNQKISTGDINNDGYLDLLFISHNGLSLIFGGAEGKMQEPPEYELGTSPCFSVNPLLQKEFPAIVSADFNHDGLLDLAVTNSCSKIISIMEGTADGEFNQPAKDIELPAHAHFLKIDDINNDTHSDLLVSTKTNNFLSLLGDGSGGFSAPQNTLLEAATGNFIIEDFNEDDLLDVIILSENKPEFTILKGTGDGTFADPGKVSLSDTGRTITYGDMNEDGHFDLVLGLDVNMYNLGHVVVMLGDGKGNFTMDNTYISQVINTREIKVRDFNHDDHLDLILYGAVGQLFIGDGTGKLTAINQDITLEGDMGNVSLVTEDINADSHLDLIVSCSGINKNNIDVYSGDGTGGFTSTGLEYGLPYINGELCAGDFNKDGNLDLAVAHPDTNQVGILFGLKGLIHDIALLSIESPAGRIPIDSSVTPQVNVINKGRETESFQIKFQIEELYNETIDANLNPDEQKLITFPSWTPDQRGIFEINCNILFAEDQNSSNNFLESQITVIGDSTEPDIFLIKPNRGGNTGWITTTIIGANFQEGVIIKLVKEGQEDIIADSCAFQNSEVISSSEIRAIFDLKGSETGLWDLEIINPGGSNIIASEIFQIENGEQKVWVDIIGPDEILLGETTAFSLYIGNSGNINVDYLVPMLTLPQEVDLDSITSFNENRTLIYGDTLLAYDLDMLEIPFFIRNLPPDKVAAFTLYVRGNTRASLSKLNYHKKLDKPSASPSFGWSGIILSTIECVAKNAAKNGITEPRSENNWNKAVIDGVENLAEGLAIEVITIAIEILYPPSIPFIEGIKVLNTFISGAKDVGQFLEVSNASKPFGIVSSFDPNLKVGPSGFGSQGYILDDRPFHYRIYFENVDTATASAKNIYLIDTLDSDFDISTIEFGETSHPVTNIELDSSQGIINWTFSEIYLPPNVNPPEGEGWVSFSIHPKPNLPSGTYITNRASIVFDYNEPILTPMLTNVIDKEPPISTFNSLPIEQEHLAFKIDWSGTDSESGVAWYQIYKSENGGDYELWTQTPDNSAIFIGKNENFYSFYSVAIDNVGNVETSPMSSIASTYIKAKENIAVNPNPFVPARGHEKITFFGGGVANARIKIYDKAGYLVKTLDEINGEKKLEWDATNEDGRKLASGVYIWVLAGAGEKDKGKFAIIR